MLAMDGLALAQIGPVLDIVNLGLAVTLTSVGFVAAKKSNKSLRVVWNMLILAGVAMGILELKDLVGSTGILIFAGWSNVWEFVALGSLVLAANSLQNNK